jgi:hypothetical protein
VVDPKKIPRILDVDEGMSLQRMARKAGASKIENNEMNGEKLIE